MRPISFEIRNQHSFPADFRVPVAALYRNCLGADGCRRKHGKQRHRITRQIGFGNIRLNHRGDFFYHFQHPCQFLIFIGSDNLHQQFPLTTGAAEIPVRVMAVAGIDKRLLAVQQLPSCLEMAVLQKPVDICRLCRCQFQRNTAQIVNNMGKTFKIHLNAPVNLHAKILLNGLLQKLRSAKIVGGIDAVFPVTGNFHIQIPQERCHGDGFFFLVESTQNHAVRSCAGFAVLILSHQKQVYNLYRFRIFFRRSLQFRGHPLL